MRKASTAKSVKSKASTKTKVKGGSAREAHFKVKAQPDSIVFIAGTFNQWDPAATAMLPDEDGYYHATLMLPVGQHEYKYLIDGVWRLDPTCPSCVTNAFGSQNHLIEIC